MLKAQLHKSTVLIRADLDALRIRNVAGARTAIERAAVIPA
jgi:hypothetical protein